MSKGLKIFIIAIAVVLSVTAVGVGLGVGLSKNNEPETEVLTVNIDGENVKKVQLEPGDNIYTYISENYAEYTDFNTCGWFVDKSMTHSLTEGDTIAEGENVTVYTRNATLDKLTFTLNDDEATYSVSAKSEDIEGEVVIPRMYTDTESTKTGLVTKVADNGFAKDSESEYLDNLTLVAMPNSIETIGTQAFYYNRSLTFINLPYGLTTIGEKAITGNYSMVSLTIPETVTEVGSGAIGSTSLAEVYNYSPVTVELGSGAGMYAKVVYNASDLTGEKPASRIKTIGNMNYYVYGDDFIVLAPTVSRAKVTEVVLDNKTTEINAYAFNYCVALETINMPKSVQKIGRVAFQHCESLSSEIVIPEGVTEIPDYAFNYCYNLPSVTIPDSVQSIGRTAFQYCESLSSIVIPEGVTEIPNYTFYMCINLTSVTIPDSVQSIGEAAFYYDYNINSIVLPESLTSIGAAAFYGNFGLRSINIPKNVTSIGEDAFGFMQVAEVYNYSDLIIEQGATENGYLGYFSEVIYNADDLKDEVPESKIQAIDGIKYYVNGDDFIALSPETKTGSLRQNVTNVVLDERTTAIANYAFYYCEDLSDITIPNTVKSIGDRALSRCNFTSVVIPEGVEYLGSALFNVNNNLVQVSVPNSVTTMADGVFMNCPNLKVVNLPEGMTEIPARTFNGAGIETFTFSENIETVGTSAFWSCTKLETIIVDSAAIYKSLTSNSACGFILNWGANTVKVLASIVDNPENTNNWLNGSAWTKSESADGEGYYTYTRVVS